MGDLFFMIRMFIYTFIMVILMQVKIGPTTLEEKVIDFTHNSTAAGYFQGVAQGAAKFIGVQYRHFTGQLKSDYIEKYSGGESPGNRLKTRLKELKETIDSEWKEKSKQVKESLEQNQPVQDPEII